MIFRRQVLDRCGSRCLPVEFVTATSSHERACYRAFSIREYPGTKWSESSMLSGRELPDGEPASVSELDGTVEIAVTAMLAVEGTSSPVKRKPGPQGLPTTAGMRNSDRKSAV